LSTLVYHIKNLLSSLLLEIISRRRRQGFAVSIDIFAYTDPAQIKLCTVHDALDYTDSFVGAPGSAIYGIALREEA
jgi:hypothetical protein